MSRESSSRGAPTIRARSTQRTRNPKVHGDIPGIPVGATWATRLECSQAGVHAPLQGGIHGNMTDGAFSVVLSGGYEDDEDHGETITYTGQGGRNTKGDKMDQLKGKVHWSGPQNSDQEWVRGNRALQLSCTAGHAVRVIRGYTLESRYAPPEGYRYDGLYRVVDAWRAKGKSGFLTCRFTFKRLSNQPPLPGEKLITNRRSTNSTASSSRVTVDSLRVNETPSTTLGGTNPPSTSDAANPLNLKIGPPVGVKKPYIMTQHNRGRQTAIRSQRLTRGPGVTPLHMVSTGRAAPVAGPSRPLKREPPQDVDEIDDRQRSRSRSEPASKSPPAEDEGDEKMQLD
ncbi:PUA-like domain-containing protein [Infundibulicybe gibba]|nr:PUA-like domain-containing protein [Infundibulicybe gibba]